MATRDIAVDITAANLDLLHRQLKTLLQDKFSGVSGDRNGFRITIADDTPQNQIAQAIALTLAHNPEDQTPEQAEAATGVANVSALLATIDTALTDLTAKRAAFQSTPTLANAAPLLLEVSQDLIGVLRAMKYVLKRIP